MAHRTLPPLFTAKQAREFGLGKKLARMRLAGDIERLGRGMYRRRGAEPPHVEIIRASAKYPVATLCLGSALHWHGLVPERPARTAIAVPKGSRVSANRAVLWCEFDRKTFELGREFVRVIEDLPPIAVYSAERSVLDALRIHAETGEPFGRRQLQISRGGDPYGQAALARWLEQPGNAVESLLELAARLPAGVGMALRHALRAIEAAKGR